MRTHYASNTSLMNGPLPLAFGYSLTLGLALASWVAVVWVLRLTL